MPFQVTQRQTIVFVAGLALGVAGAWALFSTHGGVTEHGADRKAPVASAKVEGVAPVSVAVDACSFTPVVTTAASDDGRVQLLPSVSGRGPKDIEAWLLDGKEAVAAGRQRDAESDFLMACRAAEQLGDAGVLPQAEAMYHLGRHYAGLAGAAPAARAGELRKRAQGLYTASLKAFDARYGKDSDKTRFAAKGLAELQAQAGGTTEMGAAATPAKVAESKAPEVKLAKVAPPKLATPTVEPAKVEPPKEVPRPVVEAKAVPEHKAAAPEAKAAPESKALEPQVAVAKPAPPKPHAAPAPAPAPAAGESTVVEPPARASGSATGHVDEPADGNQQ